MSNAMQMEFLRFRSGRQMGDVGCRAEGMRGVYGWEEERGGSLQLALWLI
jgi:hypothetical protein